jgi:hypothetical protein
MSIVSLPNKDDDTTQIFYSEFGVRTTAKDSDNVDSHSWLAYRAREDHSILPSEPWPDDYMNKYEWDPFTGHLRADTIRTTDDRDLVKQAVAEINLADIIGKTVLVKFSDECEANILYKLAANQVKWPDAEIWIDAWKHKDIKKWHANGTIWADVIKRKGLWTFTNPRPVDKLLICKD